MGLPQEYRDKLKTLVRREDVTLPELGLGVTVRGLTGGEVVRTIGHERSADLQIAMSTERDGEPIWNPQSRQDLDEIGELSTLDRTVLLQASNRLSGLGKLQALLSQQSESETGVSQSDSAAPFPS